MFDNKTVSAIKDLTEAVEKLNATMSEINQAEPVDPIAMAKQLQEALGIALHPITKAGPESVVVTAHATAIPSSVKGIRVCR